MSAGSDAPPKPVVGRGPLVELGPELTAEERQRYARQILLPTIGMEGQRRLKNARVLCIGAGGLGSPVLLYLAAAGIGTLGVIDDDRVDESNLQRQIIHGTSALGQLKVESAAARINELNPHVTVRTHAERLTPGNALAILGDYDVIVDGADNFATRYLVADAAEILRQPVVWGSLLREQGQLSVFWAGVGPTYRDLFPTMPNPDEVPTCAAAGVLGAVCAAIGAAMANEAVKLITGVGRSLIGRLQIFDALEARWREITLTPDTAREAVTQLQETYEWECAPSETGPPESAKFIEPDELEQLLNGSANVTLVDVRTSEERAIDAIGPSIHVPLDEVLDSERFAAINISPTDDLIVYCQSGARSARAASALQERGYRVRDLHGGIVAYRRDVSRETSVAAAESQWNDHSNGMGT